MTTSKTLKIAKEIFTNQTGTTYGHVKNLDGSLFLFEDTFLPASSKQPEFFENALHYVGEASKAPKFQHSIYITKKELTYVSRAMANRDVRYYLNGLAVYKNGNVCATDGHRCHGFINSESDKSFKTDDASLLPNYAIKTLLRIMTAKTYRIDVKISENGYGFLNIDNSNVTIVFKSIDGRYPDVERVIWPHKNKSTTWLAGIDIKRLKDEIKPFCNKKYNGIKLDLEQQTIVASNPDSGEHVFENAFYKCTETSDFSIGFNINYLIDALNDGNKNHFCDFIVSDKNSCGVVKTGNLMAVVMPMRL